MSDITDGIDWNNPSHMPLSNGPIRTVTGPAQPTHALDSDRSEMEYLLPFPFHAIDPNPWPAICFLSKGIPITIYRPIGTTARHSTTFKWAMRKLMRTAQSFASAGRVRSKTLKRRWMASR
jgi:hypothetical protein